MEQLAGQIINIVLSLKEGRGFDLVGQHPILVEAELENNILDASLSPPSPQPQFGVEFLWETTEQAAQKLQSAKVPLRIEFYSIIDNRKRSKIGFVLVNLSSAYLVPKEGCHDKYPRAWCKLIVCGTTEANSPHPEVLVGLRIEDGGLNSQQFSQVDTCKQLGKDQERTRHDISCMSRHIPIVNVGPELIGINTFYVEIVCSKVYNLDCVISTDMPDPIGKAHLVYEIFGTSIRSLPSTVNTESSKTCITIRSSMPFLYQHSRKNPSMKIHLMTENTELAYGEADVHNLIPIDNLDLYLQQYALSGTEVQANHIKLTPKDYDGINLNNDLCYPYVDVVRLQYNPPVGIAIKMQDKSSTVDYFTIDNATCTVLQSAGEVYPIGEISTQLPIASKTLPLTSNRKPASTSHIPSPRFPTSLTSHLEPALKEPLPKEVYYNTYALEVSVKQIIFYKLPTQETLFFKFHHPRAEISATSYNEILVNEINTMVHLENTKCTFKFVTSAEELSRILITWPPNISVCTNLENQTIQLATAMIYSGCLFVEKNITCWLPLIETPIVSEVGSILIGMSLEQLDSCHNEGIVLRQIVSDGGFRVRPDEVVKSVAEELHLWKERQEEIFNTELTCREKRHMSVMAAEFKKKRDMLQNRLHRDLLQCRTVIQTLHAALDENRASTRKHFQMEADLKLRQEDLDTKYRIKFQDLREASKRMEDNLHCRMKAIERENSELHLANNRLQKANLVLQQTINDQEVNLEVCQKGSLSKDQIASLLQETKLLQEKLKEATESKTQFKQQWAQAVREIHKIKCDHQESIQIQIRDFKEELKSLGFQRFFNDECELLDNQCLVQQMGSYVINELSGYDDYSLKLNKMFPDSSPLNKGITLPGLTCHKDMNQ